MNPANQPDKIFVSSDDVPVQQMTYYSFSVDLKQPVLHCNGIQLGSFVQPNNPSDGPCIADYECNVGFLYYKQSSSNVIPVNNHDMQQVYLLASTNIIGNASENWINRYYSSYSDLVTVLNNASVALGAGPGGSADVVFGYDTTNRRIYFYGTDNTQYYMPAGFNDPLVQSFATQNDQTTPINCTLNQRLGFTNPNYNFNQQAIGGTTSASYLYPNGFPNMVRTGSITLRTTFHNQSSINSKDNRDVLAVIPQQVPFLGVNDYSVKLNHFLTQIPETLQTLTISMYDDFGQPYYVDNNVTTLIELLCKY